MTHLDRTTWPDASRLAGTGSVLLVPLGSTEQHGPHLPVTTDTDIARALVERAATLDRRVVIAPALSYGSSGEHQGFAGTLSIGQEATELLLVELGRSASVDFHHTVVVSAHGGNAAPLARAMVRLDAEGHPVRAWSPRWGGTPDLHAGRTETSLMMAIAPERVDLERAEPGDLRPVGDLLPVLREQGVAAASANGVLGDPVGASADEGRRLLVAAVEDLVTMLADLADCRPLVAGR